MERVAFIFSQFDHIVVAFSGGKGSGLLLELIGYSTQSEPKGTQAALPPHGGSLCQALVATLDGRSLWGRERPFFD